MKEAREGLVHVGLVLAGAALAAGRAGATVPVPYQDGGTEGRSGQEADVRVRRIVERVVRQPESVDSAAREIELLGPGALGPMFAELEVSVVDTVGPAGLRAQLVLTLFQALPPGETLAFLARNVGEESAHAARRAAVLLYGEFGRAADCTRLLRVSHPPDPEEGCGSELERALAKVLSRYPGPAHDALDTRLREVDPLLFPYIVRAVGAAGSPRGLGSLTRLLGLDPAVDDVVLLEIARLSESVSPPFDHSMVEEVRDYLDASDAGVRAAAASAAGALDDHEAVRSLVELVAEDEPEVRHAAQAALGQITGLAFRADHGIWTTWLSQELAWWEHDAESAFEGLESDDLARVFASIGAISRRRLYRHDLVRELVPLLEHPEARVRQLACIGLEQLGSVTAIPFLEAFRDDQDELVRQSVRSAIEHLEQKGPASGA